MPRKEKKNELNSNETLSSSSSTTRGYCLLASRLRDEKQLISLSSLRSLLYTHTYIYMYIHKSISISPSHTHMVNKREREREGSFYRLWMMCQSDLKQVLILSSIDYLHSCILIRINVCLARSPPITFSLSLSTSTSTCRRTPNPNLAISFLMHELYSIKALSSSFFMRTYYFDCVFRRLRERTDARASETVISLNESQATRVFLIKISIGERRSTTERQAVAEHIYAKEINQHIK